MGSGYPYTKGNGNGVLGGAWGARRQNSWSGYWILGAVAAGVLLVQYLLKSQARTTDRQWLMLRQALRVRAACGLSTISAGHRQTTICDIGLFSISKLCSQCQLSTVRQNSSRPALE